MNTGRKSPAAAVRGVRESLGRADHGVADIWARARSEAQQLQARSDEETNRQVRRRIDELKAAQSHLDQSAREISARLRLIADGMVRAAGEIALDPQQSADLAGALPRRKTDDR